MKKATNKDLERLKELIKKQGLDYSWLNYGGFTSKFRPESYHPDHRDKKRACEGLYNISVGSVIYQITDEWDFFINEKQNEDFLKFIEQQNKRPVNKKSFNQTFNAYTYEVTIYSNAFLKQFGGRWYKYLEMDEKLPFNASNDRDKKLFNEAKERAERMKKNIESKGYKVDGVQIKKKYLDVHYTPEEWTEILDLCKTAGINSRNHPSHQSRRILKQSLRAERKKDFKEVTLKTTGRKMLLEIHTWGWNFVELEPVIK